MSQILIERAHNLKPKALRTMTERLAERLAEQYEMRCHWEGDQLFFKRTGVKGCVRLAKDTVHIEVELGFLFLAFEKKIRQEIEKVLDKRLSKVV